MVPSSLSCMPQLILWSSLVCASQGVAADLPADVADALNRLRAFVEHDDHGKVIGVDFNLSIATDEDLSLLNQLPHLESLGVSGVKLSTVGLKHISTLTTLKVLGASNPKCTDADVKYIAGLKSLEQLYLAGSSVSDRAISDIASLPHLKTVDLSFTRVTPAGLRQLRNALPELHVREVWKYSVGFINGRAVFDCDRATVAFDDIRGPINAGGTGSMLQVSKESDDDQTASSYGVSAGLLGGISSSVIYENGVPTIRMGQHQLQILEEGTVININGQSFPLMRNKTRFVVDADGARYEPQR